MTRFTLTVDLGQIGAAVLFMAAIAGHALLGTLTPDVRRELLADARSPTWD